MCIHRALTTITSLVMHLNSNRKFNFEKHFKKRGVFPLCYCYAYGKRNARGIPQFGNHLPVTVIVRGRQLFEVPISLRVKKKKQNSKGNKIIS